MATETKSVDACPALEAYIRTIVPVMLDAPPEILEKAIANPSAQAKIKTFASENPPVLFILKEGRDEEEGAALQEANLQPTDLHFNLEVLFSNARASGVVLIKRQPGVPLDGERSVASQLQIVNFVDQSPFETIHTYVHNSFAPFLRSFLNKEHGEKRSEGGYAALEQKMTELEMSLYNCKQDVQIESVSLNVQPEIKLASSKCAQEGKSLTPAALGSLVESDAFLKSLQASVKSWIVAIQKVTKHERITTFPEQSTTAQEVKFWLELDRALHSIDAAVKSPEVQCTLNALRQQKRYFATIAFDSDSLGLGKALTESSNVKNIMKDFPIDQLLTASNISSLITAVEAIFSHLMKSLKSFYPIPRFVSLMDAVSRDVSGKLLSLISSKNLMLLPFEEFEKVWSECSRLFKVWDKESDQFISELRTQAKKRGQDKTVSHSSFDKKPLQIRLKEVHKFRVQHEELRSVIVKVLPSSGAKAGERTVEGEDAMVMDPFQEISDAYEPMKAIDVLDLSPAGFAAWEHAVKEYENRIDRVESQITAKLRDKLGAAKNANEMFRVFSKFNALFFRPRIRGAIQEYQNQLIQRVKEDISKLHEKFKVKYARSQACRLSRLRDIPPVSGTIIWIRQIERQLDRYMKRVEDILGDTVHQNMEGRKLKEDGERFRARLQTTALFESWIQEVTAHGFDISNKPLLDIQRRGKSLQLRVNFDESMATLFKEVRNLQWLGFSIPWDVARLAQKVKRVYPFAVSLSEIIRTYSQLEDHVKEDVRLLLSSYKRDVQHNISQGFSVEWQSVVKLEPCVRNLSLSVNTYKEKVEDLSALYTQLESKRGEIMCCPLVKKADSSVKALPEVLADIQIIVDQLNLGNYSNLEGWVREMDATIADKLSQRLSKMIDAWLSVFGVTQEEEEEKANAVAPSPSQKRRRRRRLPSALGSQGTVAQEGAALETGLVMTPITHEIVIRDQILQLHPPLAESRSAWTSQLREWLGLVCDIPRLQAARYDQSIEEEDSKEDRAYHSILMNAIADGRLVQAYQVIETKLQEVDAYVKEWLQYQTLWDMDPQIVFNKLGESSIEPWKLLLEEIKAARKTFDTFHTEKKFGPIIVAFGQVQSKVSHKYDFWHQDIVNRLGAMVGENNQALHSAIANARADLEPQTADTSSTADAVRFIITVKQFQAKRDAWASKISDAKVAHAVLKKNRYNFPQTWLEYGMLDGEWQAFLDMLNRKSESIESQLPVLRSKISQQSDAVLESVDKFVEEWREQKPLRGDIPPAVAINQINAFEAKHNKLQQDLENVNQARAAMEIEFQPDTRLEPIVKEMEGLKFVWTQLKVIWDQIDSLKELPWSALFPRKIRSALEAMLTDMKNMPNKIRQYQAFEYVQNQLKIYLKYNTLVADLKSEALRDRHWRQLRKALNAKWAFHELTLGKIWDSDLQKHEDVFKSVIMTAQGELALEEFLKDIREYWQSFQLELVSYQNKTKLIKGWDDMFAKLGDNMNSVSAMRMSPYFKVFEEEASHWEEKLGQMYNVFDVWLEVQRKWVYLEGIFVGSSDIENLLPRESQRFKSINKDFMGLMRKVSSAPLILDVLHIENLQKTLEHIKDMLEKIQKALGEYLEQQRQAFPRFYFVGDGDLLEIIGNSKEITRIMKHFRKMFAGLAMLVLEEDGAVITGMASREGEQVLFNEKIVLKNYSRINEWLTKVEEQMKVSLATQTEKAIDHRRKISPKATEEYKEWVAHWPAQLVLLACQVCFTERVEAALEKGPGKAGASLEEELVIVKEGLDWLADQILDSTIAIMIRRKYENLITEMVHQRDVLRRLIAKNIASPSDFTWLYEMRFYWNRSKAAGAPKITGQAREGILTQLTVEMANAAFYYGFEYLGVPDRLVQTPLTDRCYLSLTQALEARMGGSPFGPAGTGKTETVKALGGQLGRFVLVFCCDENFDFQAMSRIFVGLCQCGAWGCFDEFNRLEERILSAVSQQIQLIQVGLKEGASKLELIGREITLNADAGSFITMNPGYAGRSNLPDNLKQLFRGIAMIVPDRELIAQVMLYAQGFKSAEVLASKIVPFFRLCTEQLSSQSHYDFGLRALKSVLVRAGNMKRQLLRDLLQSGQDALEDMDAKEQIVIIKAINESVTPKLVAEDISLLMSLLTDVFPNTSIPRTSEGDLRKHFQLLCKQRHLIPSEQWTEKAFQLYQIQTLAHGVMIVGPSGSGKTCAWRTLLDAMGVVGGVPTESYVIDPKAISKDELYGVLDHTTREWTDGLFTSILRAIIDNLRGESLKTHWIVFDGDVDPEWVENLNSLLDDNKILTLPTGERLAMPDNVRIVFEVKDLKFATPATVSRCGMVWFSESSNSLDMIHQNYLLELEHVPIDDQEREIYERKLAAAKEAGMDRVDAGEVENLVGLRVQREVVEIVRPYFLGDTSFVMTAYDHISQSPHHIMEWTRLRCVNAVFALLKRGVRDIIEYNSLHSDFPLQGSVLRKYVANRVLYSVLWGYGGSLPLSRREELGLYLKSIFEGETPSIGEGEPPMLDYKVDLETGNWVLWKDEIPVIDVEPHLVGSPDIVIPTVDTTRHVEVLGSWLADRRPVLLCGPPGSGKSMTLTSVLRNLPDVEMVTLNFSSASGPELIHKTFDQHCQYKRTSKGIVLEPILTGKWLIVFCDEINLPSEDAYGTQKVISFIRQLTEHQGFWRTEDHHWVHLDRIQFVGACNPPQDAGRVALTERFMRWFPLLFVDFPARTSLQQIYGTYYRALLTNFPNIQRSLWSSFTDAMVDFYLDSQKRFTPDIHPHYIYSPRELSRWLRALWKAVSASGDDVDWTLNKILRLFAHEALRLFQDRLVELDEREWTDKKLDETIRKYFPSVEDDALKRPILFSDWLTKEYSSVSREELRFHVKAKLKVFYEEELEVKLVLFNEVLDHILRINRVLQQSQGHMLLIGVSGGGKTVLSRFVSWMNGMTVFTIKVNNRYTAEDFDNDLRGVLRRAGCEGEKICFIFDESNVLESSFLERMNTLLASGEIPGLFDGDEHTQLIHHIKEATTRKSLIMDSEDEMFKWFTNEVRNNLHVVFTMNPASPDFHNRTATSPALFNRCVLDWFGDWSNQAFYQVGMEFTRQLDLDNTDYITPDFFPHVEYLEMENDPPTHRDAVISSLVYIHQTVDALNERVAKQGLYNYVTPRHYLDFITKFSELVNEKREELEEQKLHLNIGLQKLRDTENDVSSLQSSLAEKGKTLTAKNQEANEKLKQMLEKQQIAEERKKDALQLKEQVTKQDADIAVRKVEAERDLAQAEPAVEQARKSVSSIKKEHLNELRALGKPPRKVQIAMEAICVLLGKGQVDWKEVRRIIMQADFIPSILNFDSEAITPDMRKQMKGYMDDPEFTYEQVNRASKACGPLVQWARAQMFYAQILHNIEPLRAELRTLEVKAKSLSAKLNELNSTVQELESEIQTYKEDYAILIRETEAIKMEMSDVETKVSRSVSLLRNLSSEKGRWERQSETFQMDIATIVGDCLLSSAFLAYIGFFDQSLRRELMTVWRAHLEEAGVHCKPDLSIVDYLCSPGERLEWIANELPADDLCTENAIMLRRFNRYPLVIDPAGQATAFLMKQHADKRITRTSFLDSSFMKHLETALRFGLALLVDDVESIDPVLNPVLNKEIRKTGGRILIRLGDQDVDFSPSFMIFLATRDPAVHFTPDLCSRVTFVNFTVTPSGLTEQCLHSILKAEAPDVYEKRKLLITTQGECKVKLKKLEENLLDTLNKTEGNILEDNTVIATMEHLKNETKEIEAQFRDTEKVFAEIEQVSLVFKDLAACFSKIYFVLDSLSQIHFLYVYSLEFFQDIFFNILHHNENLKNVSDRGERMEILLRDLFLSIYHSVCGGLSHEDQIVFALRLAQLKISIKTAGAITAEEIDFLLKGGDRITVDGSEKKVALSREFASLLDEKQVKMAEELSRTVSTFSALDQNVVDNSEEWEKFLKGHTAENAVPLPWLEQSLGKRTSGAITPKSPVVAFHILLLLKSFRPDRVPTGFCAFINSVFDEAFLRVPELDLPRVVEAQKSTSPILLCSTPGYDASFRVEEMASNARKTRDTYKSVALGSAEGFELADKAVNEAVKKGTWVLLKNCHLAPQWLVTLEKKLHAVRPHENFRLFLTADIHPALPSNLIRQSRVFVFEPPPGVKANMKSAFSGLSKMRMEQEPKERTRLYFLLAWFHSVVQERLRYAPIGWSKMFEFGDSDFRGACSSLDYWVSAIGKGRDHVDPEEIPWKAFRTIMGESLYGGRVDNPFDQRLLDSFLQQLFTEKAFNYEYPLLFNEDVARSVNHGDETKSALVVPEGRTKADFEAWIDNLPENASPVWLGLPEKAELLLLVHEGKRSVQKLLRLQDFSADGGSNAVDKGQKESGEDGNDVEGVPPWILKMRLNLKTWSGMLPTTGSLTELLKKMQKDVDSAKVPDPLKRCFLRELQLCIAQLQRMRRDFGEMFKICSGEMKLTNYLRSLMLDLSKGLIPKHWRTYTVPDSTTLGSWLKDLQLRSAQLQRIAQSDSLGQEPIWLGGLFNPEGM